MTFPEQLSPKKLVAEMEKKRSKGFDVTLSQHLKDNYEGMTIDKLYAELDVDPMTATVGLILDRDESQRWLVPEIFRDAIRKGFINAPIYKDLIVREEPIPQLTQVMPFWDLTGLPNAPQQLGVAESMTLGSLKYGQKSVRVGKTGIGLEVADECIQYSSIAMLSLWLMDVGVKLGSSLGSQLITTLINGDQADGSEAAPSVGITQKTSDLSGAGVGLQYADFIRMSVRAALRNRKWTKIVGGEDMINTVLDLTEFRRSNKIADPELTLNLKTPVPRNWDAYVHNAVPSGQLLMVDSDMAAVQLTAQPLKVESERIIQRQINGTYVSLTTGFAIIFRDARIIMDSTQDIGAAPFPSWLAPLY